MIRLRVVAHFYFEKPYYHIVDFYDSYFPIGAVCDLKDGKIISPIDDRRFQHISDTGLKATSSFSAIVFAPVSEHDQ